MPRFTLLVCIIFVSAFRVKGTVIGVMMGLSMGASADVVGALTELQ